MDLRQQRTREALYAALIRLLSRMPYKEIGVADLAREAKIGRPTFYQHFPTIDAMLVERLDEDLAEQLTLVRREFARIDYSDEAYARLATFAFERVQQSAQLYKLILGGQAGGVAVARFQAQLAELGALLLTSSNTRAPDDLDALVRGYLSGAISSLLAAWLESGMQRSPEEMGRLFVDLVNGQALERLGVKKKPRARS